MDDLSLGIKLFQVSCLVRFGVLSLLLTSLLEGEAKETLLENEI